MFSKEKVGLIIDTLGLISIGIISLGYVMFYSSFAELHIKFSFLDFPIFIGEWLIFFCLLLTAIKWRMNPKVQFSKGDYLIIAYFIFVVTKAIIGYVNWGPLAFRHAALFYYPFFIVLSYTFLGSKNINRFLIIFIALILLALFVFNSLHVYWILTCASLFIVLLIDHPNKVLKYLFLGLLICCIPYRGLFYTSRMMLLANSVAILFIIFTFITISNVHRNLKVILLIVGLFLFTAGLLNLSDKTYAKSIFSINPLIETYKAANKSIEEKANSFELEHRERVLLYNPNKKKSALEKYKKNVEQTISTVFVLNKKKPNVKTENQHDDIVNIVASPEITETNTSEVVLVEKHMPVEKTLYEEKYFKNALNNAVFRLLIWRDMLTSLMEHKPILGFDFGKPLRSISLEILSRGAGEWKRDGWVAAHNSYLHIVYRSGIFGIALIVMIFVILFKMIVTFVRYKSLKGIFLCSILINWFVAANFLLILELPYTAIPIWSIYGATYLYYQQLSKKHKALGYVMEK